MKEKRLPDDAAACERTSRAIMRSFEDAKKRAEALGPPEILEHKIYELAKKISSGKYKGSELIKTCKKLDKLSADLESVLQMINHGATKAASVAHAS